jgi:hypothetical protein
VASHTDKPHVTLATVVKYVKTQEMRMRSLSLLTDSAGMKRITDYKDASTSKKQLHRKPHQVHQSFQ